MADISVSDIIAINDEVPIPGDRIPMGENVTVLFGAYFVIDKSDVITINEGIQIPLDMGDISVSDIIAVNDYLPGEIIPLFVSDTITITEGVPMPEDIIYIGEDIAITIFYITTYRLSPTPSGGGGPAERTGRMSQNKFTGSIAIAV
jgi:hypothetical protein